MNLAKQGLPHDAYCVIVIITADNLFFFTSKQIIHHVYIPKRRVIILFQISDHACTGNILYACIYDNIVVMVCECCLFCAVLF